MQPINYQEIFKKYKIQIFLAIGGTILIIGGSLVLQNKINLIGSKVEIVKDNNFTSPSPTSLANNLSIVVDVSGSVEKPGVYHLSAGDRVEDALIASGGLSANADRNWVDKYLNKAAKLIDGQKIFVPSSTGSNVAQFSSSSDVSTGVDPSGLININSASASQLDNLPGIGQVYAQNIIDHRPYSDINDLITNKVLKQSVFDKIKNQISVY